MRKDGKKIEGVAVYPKKIGSGEVAKVGVWVRRDITSQQRTLLLSLNATSAPGHIIVSSGIGGTAVAYVDRVSNVRAAKKTALSLSRAVEALIGARSVPHQLKDWREVSLALRV